MRVVIEYVAANPGCTKLDAGRAHWCKGEGNMAYLYGPVNRCINSDYVLAIYRGGKYSLEVSAKGMRALGIEQ